MPLIPKPLWIILGCGLVARLALWAWFSGLPIHIDDERDYNGLAVRLAERGEFCADDGTPVSLRPPLYPALVAACYRLFGLESFQSVRFVQAALSLVTVVVVHRLGSAMFSPRVGLWASGLYCFYPSLLVFDNLLLTETLFTLLLCVSCLALVRALGGSRLSGFAAAGVWLGLGALTRSVLSVFPPFLALFVLVAWKAPFARRVLAALALWVAFGATISPWAVRNTQIQGTLVTVDVMGGRNFMMGNYEHTPLDRAWDAITIGGDKAWYRVLAEKHGPLQGLTQGQIDKLAMRAGLEYVREHPALTLKRDLVKFINFWQLERELVAGASRGYFGDLPRWTFLLCTAAILGAYAACLFAAVLGAVLAPPADWRGHALVGLTVALICGVHAVVFGHSRYHLPLVPLLLMYSAAAVVDRQRIWELRRSGRFALAAALCATVVAGWTYEAVVVDWQQFRDALQLFG